MDDGLKEKTEREKMLAGELYVAADPALSEDRGRARSLTRLYNATTEEEPERRRALLVELLGRIGTDVTIEPPFHCDYGAYISIGDGFFMNFGGVILDCSYVRIGENVQCGPNVQICAATHPLAAAQRILGPELGAPITIG